MARTIDQLAKALDDGMVPPPGILTVVPDVGFELPDLSNEAAIEAAEAYVLEDLDSAEWAMSMLREMQRTIDERADAAAQFHKRIDAWLEGETREAEFWRHYFAARLELYGIEQRIRSGGKVKTINLPSGKIPTRSSKPAVVIDDADAVLAWAQQQELDDLIKTYPKVLVTDLRDVVQVLDRAAFRDDEIVVDCRIVDGPPEVDGGPSVPVAFDAGGALLDDVTIVDGPFVLHIETGVLVDGVSVSAESISATPTPAT